MFTPVPELTNAMPHKAHRGQWPPALKGWPLVGALPKLLRQQQKFLLDAQQQVGDIYTAKFGPQQVIILNHPDHAQHVLRDHIRNYRKGSKFFDMVRGVFGNGLVTSEGAFWLRQRRLVAPQFHRHRLAALTNLIVAAINQGLDAWQFDSHQPLDLSLACSEIMMKVITQTMFSDSIEASEIVSVSKAMTYAFDYLIQGLLLTSLPTWTPVPGLRRFRQAPQTIDAVLKNAIMHNRQALQAGHPADNLLTMLLCIVDEETGAPMTDQQLCDEVRNIFLAGYETTAIAITWAFGFLIEHPDKLAKLQTEVTRVLRSQTPTIEEAMQLTYTRMVLQEALRLRPSGWFLPRLAVDTDTIGGYTIPSGSTVILPIFVYHHRPDFWEEPFAFTPERFSPEAAQHRHPFAWLPFGAGQRVCIGRDYALLVGQLILALAFQRYTLTPAGKQLPAPKLSATLRPQGGLWAYINQRIA